MDLEGREALQLKGWADTPEGIVALECVEGYVRGLLKASQSRNGLNTARHLTAPKLVAEGLQGCGVPSNVTQPTIELVQQVHDCLNARPADKAGAQRAIRTIRRLWQV